MKGKGTKNMNELTPLPKIYTNLHIGGSHDGKVIECRKDMEFHVIPKLVPKNPILITDGELSISEESVYFTEEYQKRRFRASNKIYILEVLSELSDADVMEALINCYKNNSAKTGYHDVEKYYKDDE